MQVPRPMESAFPDVRVPTQAPIEAFGGRESAAAASGATRKLAMDQAAFHQQHLEDALNTEVQANVAKLTDQETAQKVALSKVKGKDAMAAGSKAIEDFGKFHEDLAKNTANPVVKQATLMHFQRSRANLSGWAQDYGNQQYQRYQDDTDHATVKSEMNAAIADGRPDRINQALANQQLALEGMGRRHGWDEKTTSLAVAEAKSGTHFGVLNSMLAQGNDQAGKNYFEANKGQFVGSDLINAEKLVQAKTTLGEAYRWTDVIMSYEPTTMQDALTHLDKLVDQEKIDSNVRKEASSLIENRWRAQEHARLDAQNKVFEGLAEDFRKNGDFDALRKSPQWETLSERDKEHLESMASRYSKSNSFYADKNDPVATTNFYAMSKEDLAQLSKADLLRYVPRVKEATYGEMEKHWHDARQKEDDASFKFTEHEEKYVFQKVKDAGLATLTHLDKMGGLTTAKADAYNPIREEVKDALKVYLHENRKNANQEEREKIINDIVVEKAINEKYAYNAANRFGDALTGGVTGYIRSRYLIPADVRKSINDDVVMLTGKDASGHKLEMLWRAKKLGASKDELRKIALQE